MSPRLRGNRSLPLWRAVALCILVACAALLSTRAWLLWEATRQPRGTVREVFREVFDTQSINRNTWIPRDGQQNLAPEVSGLDITGWQSSPGWGDPGMYSVQAFSHQAGRTLAVSARTLVGAVNGPLFLLSPSRFPAHPTSGGYGAGFTSRLGLAGNGGRDLRLTAVTPNGEIRYGPLVAENHGYLFTTTLRPAGSFHFVSGGAMGAFPEATLMWVTENSAGRMLHVGIDTHKTQASVNFIRLLDLSGAFATQDGLAIAADTFKRSGAGSLGATPKGGFMWRVEAGEWQMTGAGLVRRPASDASATFDPQAPDGIFEVTFSTPRGEFASPSLYVRYLDESNWLRFTCNTSIVRVEQAVNGAVSPAYQSGATGCAPNAQHRLVVRAHGDNVDVWLNDKGIGIEEDGLTLANPSTGTRGTRVGLGVEAGAASPTFLRMAVWPRMVTLPEEVGPFPPLPDAGVQVIASDTFLGESGTRLRHHRPAVGEPWTEHGREWVIGHEGLIPPEDGGLATLDVGVADMTVTTTVRLATGSGWGTTDGWQVGPVLRYSDPQNYIWARFLYQQGSPEIELWERQNSTTQQLNAKNITGLVAPGGTHAMRVAALGPRLVVYLDDLPIAEGTTSLLHGTRAGLVIDEDAVNVSTFTAFQVAHTKAAPSAVQPSPAPTGIGSAPHAAAVPASGGPDHRRAGNGAMIPTTDPPALHAADPSRSPTAMGQGVPHVPVNYDADVEAWWAAHPFNPERPDAIPVGGIGSPEPMVDVTRDFQRDIQAAIDALPPTGGTLFFSPGTYTAEFTLAGRNNVHFISNGGATLRAGTTPVLASIGGCRLALDYGAFARAVRLGSDPQHGSAMRCLMDRARNIYFRDLTFDGDNRATTAIHLAAVAAVVFDRVTFHNFVDPMVSHGGLVDGAAMLDNVWCRECRFVGRARWALYLDGLHGGGVISSRIEDGFAVGGLLFLTNDDFTGRYVDPDVWHPSGIRTGAYIVVYGNTFAAGGYQAMGIAARNVLVMNNTVEGYLPRGFAGFDTKSSMIWPDLIYEYFGSKVIGNRTKDLSALAGFNQESGTHNPAWSNRARLGRYSVRDNVIEGAAAMTALVRERGDIDGPITVEKNCVNGREYSTNEPCGAPDVRPQTTP